jgi:hypothetical protein
VRADENLQPPSATLHDPRGSPLIVERHQSAATVVTSNREPLEWLALMADPLLAQSAIDRLQSAAYELVLEGDSFRRRQKPTVNTTDTIDLDEPARRTPSSPRRR